MEKDTVRSRKFKNRIYKEIQKPLENIKDSPLILEFRLGETFSKKGNQKGIHIGTYDQSTSILKLKCYFKSGGQSVYIKINLALLDEIREYISSLNKKYFKVYN